MEKIGLFKERYGIDYPSIYELISEKPIKNKDKVVSYMKNGEKIAVAACYVKDVITGERTNRELLCYSDGTYMWQSDALYYVEKYNMQLPDEFINHILCR